MATLWRYSAALAQQAVSSGDALAFTVENLTGGHAAFLYDPATHSARLILDDFNVSTMEFSSDGRLAFSVYDEANPILYVADVLGDGSLLNLTDTLSLAAYAYPIGWSQGGQYLAFVEAWNEAHLLYVWDGESATDVTPDGEKADIIGYEIAWSYDNMLAISVKYRASAGNGGSEMYLWDGATTVRLLTNTAGRDSSPVWSEDNRLAFVSEQTDWNYLYTWQASDPSSRVVFLPADLVVTPSSIAWTHDGHLAFSGLDPTDGDAQIYVWDGDKAVNMSGLPGQRNTDPRWSPTGQWTFISSGSANEMLIVRDAANKTILETDGENAPAWSPDGMLIFCARQGGDWMFQGWDGSRLRIHGAGVSIEAEWRGGDGISCSSG